MPALTFMFVGHTAVLMRVEADPKFTAINLNSMTLLPGVLQRNKLRLMTLI